MPVDEDEMIDYLIDGIPDESLQNQAIMMRLTQTDDVLEAFKKIALDSRKISEREKSDFK